MIPFDEVVARLNAMVPSNEDPTHPDFFPRPEIARIDRTPDGRVLAYDKDGNLLFEKSEMDLKHAMLYGR